MLSHLTILLPLATALFALIWFIRWTRVHRLVPEANAPAREQSGTLMTRADLIVMAAVTVIYAAVAFTGLGSTKAPQGFLGFREANYYAQVELNEPQEITAFRYYTGLYPGDYTLQFSMDGENWVDQVKEDGSSGMTQQYNELFRWMDAALNPDNGPVRYIRIISGASEYLGEIAIYGEDGELLTTDEFTMAPGCEWLVDEQDTIAEKYNYKNGTYFDEVYFPRTAWEMINEVWPYEITHPPLGKAIMSLGIRIFGMTPFGWRFMGTLFGVLMLPALYIFLKKIFGCTAAAGCGTTVFAFDFMHYTQTRLATIDSYSVFFILMMYLFMYFWLTEPEVHGKRRLLWLGLTGVSFGFGAATKWVCIYAGAGLAILWALYWVVRLVRERRYAVEPLLANILWCFLFFLAIPGLVYYLSYAAYAPSQGIAGPFRPGYLQLVLDNQKYMFNYHSQLVATHPYSSKWYQWLLDIRPILYYLEFFDNNTMSTFGAFSNPLLCWGGLLAMGGMGWLAVRERDQRAMFILIGYMANLLPWVLVSRLTFAYHYFPCTLFLVLALSYLFADLRRRDPKWRVSVGAFTAVCVGLFAMFYPVLSGVPVSRSYADHALRWFEDTWPF